MRHTQELTAAEAAFVLEEPPKAVKKALDEGPIEAPVVRRGGMMVRVLDRADVVYLYAARLLKDELTPRTRGELYAAMKHKLTRRVAFGRFKIDIADALDAVDQRLARLADLKNAVSFRADGEAVIRGTDVEVHRIAALLEGGLSPADIIEDYPGLTRKQIETARAFATAYPKAGRPYPKTTLKRVLRKSKLHALDGVLGGE